MGRHPKPTHRRHKPDTNDQVWRALQTTWTLLLELLLRTKSGHLSAASWADIYGRRRRSYTAPGACLPPIWKVGARGNLMTAPRRLAEKKVSTRDGGLVVLLKDRTF